MRFTKMQGLGNDYLYIWGEAPDDASALSRRLSDRHFGVGADGLIFISPSAAADFKMRIFNADGSEAQMCGNGIRCVGKYVYDKGYTQKLRLRIETLSGIKPLELQLRDGRVSAVSVSMGIARTLPERELTVGDYRVTLTPVSVGNPHAVLFMSDAAAAPVTALGPAIERHPAFPGGVNVEFVQALSETRLRMRVWERGSGVTLACGTGACAAVAAAIQKGLCARERPILVDLDGGTLELRVDKDGGVRMTGPARTVFEGEVPV